MDDSTRQNPYVGPRAFQIGETLFGRDREIQQLLDLLIAERIVLLHSPSGAGKSSLVSAGLIPRLEEEGFCVLPVARISQEPPTSLPADSYNRYVLSALLSFEESLPEEKRLPLDQLAAMSLTAYLDQIEAQSVCNDDDPRTNTVVVFDQFEEILTVDPADKLSKSAFFAQIGAALRNRGRWALFAMREDFVAALDPYLRTIPTRLSNKLRLDLLGADAARQAIQCPADAANVEFDSLAVDRLVDDLRRIRYQLPDGTLGETTGPYIEPVQLQVVCYRLWEKLSPDDKEISERDVISFGDVDTALGNYYAERVAYAAQTIAMQERAIREWFDRRLITKQGLRGQVLMGADQSEGLDNRAIRLLVDAHLVRGEKRGGAIWFELAHDRLIRPIQQDNATWLQANLNLLQRQASLWEEQNRPETLLLREQALDQAEAWAIAHTGELTNSELDFLKACQRQRKQEEQERARSEQEIELREQMKSAVKLRRRAVYLTLATGLALVMLVAAIFLGGQASANAVVARQQAATATYALGEVEVEAAKATAALGESLVRGTEVANQAATAEAERARAETEQARAESERERAEAAGTVAAAEVLLRSTAEANALGQFATAVYERNVAATAQVDAENQRKVALSRGLADLSLSYLDYQPDLALLLSIEAYRITDTLQARSAILTGLQGNMREGITRYGRPIPQQDTYIASLAFSPDSKRLAWASYDGIITVWDIEEQRPLWSLNAHSGATVDALAFTPDGRTLVSGGKDSVINFWDAATGKLQSQIKTDLGYVYSLAIKPDGSAVAASGFGQTIMQWDLATQKPLPSFSPGSRANENVLALAWSPNGLYLASAGEDRQVRVWASDSFKEETFVFKGHQGVINSLAWSENSRFLVTGGADEVGVKDNLIFIWDINEGIGGPLPYTGDDILSVAVSADGRRLAAGGYDRTVTVWDFKTQDVIGKLTDHTHWVKCVAFGPTDHRLLASVGFDKNIYLYEMIEQEPLGVKLAEVRGIVQSMVFTSNDNIAVLGNRQDFVSISDVAVEMLSAEIVFSTQNALSLAVFSSDGQWYAASMGDGAILTYAANSGAEAAPAITVEGSVESLAFSPDRKILAVGVCPAFDPNLSFCLQPKILLWDIASGKLLAEIPPAAYLVQQAPLTALHTDSIISLAFSPDGRTLASGSKDKTIILWDTTTYEPTSTPLTGHTTGVTSLAFSPDGLTLASGGQDGMLILWDVLSRRAIGNPLRLTSGAATSLAFGPGGLTLASGSDTRQVMLWDVSPLSWIERACELAGRNLTQAEWQQYFPGETYRLTCPQYPAGP